MLVPTIVTMLLTWLNQLVLEAFMFALPFSQMAFALAVCEFTYYLDLKDVKFADEEQPTPLELQHAAMIKTQWIVLHAHFWLGLIAMVIN